MKSWTLPYIQENNKAQKSLRTQLAGINRHLSAIKAADKARKAAEEAGEEFDEAQYLAKTIELVDIEELKDVSIKDYLVANGVKLLNSSSQRKTCCCPIHNESGPSFVLYENNNSFYCFGCGKGGTIIDLVMYTMKIDLSSAVRFLRSGYRA